MVPSASTGHQVFGSLGWCPCQKYIVRKGIIMRLHHLWLYIFERHSFSHDPSSFSGDHSNVHAKNSTRNTGHGGEQQRPCHLSVVWSLVGRISWCCYFWTANAENGALIRWNNWLQWPLFPPSHSSPMDHAESTNEQWMNVSNRPGHQKQYKPAYYII